jgi:hypothetical protein
MSKRRTGMTVDEQLAAEQLSLDCVAAGELFFYLMRGEANIHQQRRAARLLWEWMPKGMDGSEPLRASAAILVRVEAAKAKQGSLKEAYRVIAAEDGADALSVKRQHARAMAAERQFDEESRRKYFDKG